MTALRPRWRLSSGHGPPCDQRSDGGFRRLLPPLSRAAHTRSSTRTQPGPPPTRALWAACALHEQHKCPPGRVLWTDSNAEGVAHEWKLD